MQQDDTVRKPAKPSSRFARGTGDHTPVPAIDELPTHDTELAQIVHDLKNPLSSIGLEAELLDARISWGECFDATQAIDRIRRNVTFLNRLIYDLMDVCNLWNGEFSLRLVRRDLRLLLEAVIERVVSSADRARVFLDAREPIEALIDELRIERVVANLLDNALKYTPASGGIVVRLTREDDCAQVSICDAGPGLSPAEAAVVFEPYRRGETSKGRRGTGLGLYVSKRIVEAHGGSIGVESVRGSGARFYFALPAES
jgi:signal transduction histidine kinase